MYRIGVDIGGTFTDFTVADESGVVALWKEPSTPAEPTLAIENGLAAVAPKLGVDVTGLLSATDLFVHGTTIATNTVVQRNGPAIGLLCTRGFRDVVYLRDGFKPERFNIRLKHPDGFVDRHLRIGVPERIGSDGAVVIPLEEDSVRRAAETFAANGVAAVAVAFLWSCVNGEHEQRAAEILAGELPGLPIVTSAEVLPEIREWERTSAAVLSAYVAPGITDYLRRLETMLQEHGLRRPPLIMQINGGCASVAEIVRRPVNALGSGPAAAPAAATHHAAREETGDFITVDMGGTSFDVCLVRDGRATMSRTIQVEMQPIGVPGVEVHSVAAGGGSIAWIDSGGALRVGPLSAGAVPGPVCYGRGGARPTVTDANLVLGYLSPTGFLGGRWTLDRELAVNAIKREIAEPLGIGVLEAAEGIIRVVNTTMVGAIRAVSVERGIDPRSLSLVVGGGAGSLHAAELARELGMGRVIVPGAAGTFCAFGMTVTDVRHDYVRAHHCLSTSLDLSALDGLFAEMEREATDRLRADGFTDERIVLERSVDARYQGQVYELTVAVASASQLSADDIAKTVAAYHHEHRSQFTYAREELPIEFLHWRVTGLGLSESAAPPTTQPEVESDQQVPAAERNAFLPREGDQPVRVYATDDLAPGAVLVGPLVVESATTTVLLHRGDTLRVAPDSTYIVDVAPVDANGREPIGRPA